MAILVIDSETVDPLLKKIGSAAVFKFHYPSVEFEVLCFCTYDGVEKKEWTADNFNEMLEYISKFDIWVMHNAAYDLGVLKFLYRDKLPISIITIHDTMLIAKLVTQQFKSYSLDNLTQHYELVRKQSDILNDYAWTSGLYQHYHKLATGRNAHKRPTDNILGTWTITNLNLFPIDIVLKYCMQDVLATHALYKHLMSIMYDYDLTELSDIIKLCLKMKFRGMRFDKNKANKLAKDWQEIAVQSEIDFRKDLGCDYELNINSSAQLGIALESKNVLVPKTKKGNYSITSDWLEEQGKPIFTNLKRYRKALKANKDFIGKLFKYQEAIPEEYRDENVGVMYPSLKPLGATLTGRFSSGGGTGSSELNMLAISGRDEEFGLPLRDIFIPNEPGQKLICCDYSAQEPRLQVHYASLLKCTGVQPVVDAYRENPKLDYHQKVADLTNLPRKTAKTVNLGLAYAMTEHKLASVLDISVEKAQALMKQYYQLVPFMKQIQDFASYALKKNGYVKTIDGRRLYLDEPYLSPWGKEKTGERKGLSKLIQGSAAGQTMRAMVKADKAGIDIVMVIHDEILATSSQPEKDLATLTDCMESAYTLVIPMVSDGGVGDSWLKSKP